MGCQVINEWARLTDDASVGGRGGVVAEQALVQRPPNFVTFCVDELKEVQRVIDKPQVGANQLPPVKRKPSQTSMP
jgi:hypothetical protein